MDCPHCGGPIDAGARKPITHACFDDGWQAIIVGDEVRRLPVLQWRLLLLLRERFRRFVPQGFLAQWSARDPAEGGNVGSLKVQIMRVRVQLDGSPFAIAGQYGIGYGLFPVEEVAVLSYGRGRRITRAIGSAPGTTVAQWAQDQPGWPLAQFPQLQQAAAQAAARGGKKIRRRMRPGPLYRSFLKD